jgi:hypothetical protein
LTFFLTVFLAAFFTGIAKLFLAGAFGRTRGRDGFGFRHDGLADLDTRQLAEMSVSPPLYQTIQHNDLLRAISIRW